MPDPFVEAQELILVGGCRDCAGAVDKLAEAAATAQQAQTNLGIGECSQSVEEWLGGFNLCPGVLLTVGGGTYRSAQKVEASVQDSRSVSVSIAQQRRGKEVVQVTAFSVRQDDQLALREF